MMKYKKHTVANLIDILTRFDDNTPVWIYTKEGAHAFFKIVDIKVEKHLAIIIDQNLKEIEFQKTHEENNNEEDNNEEFSFVLKN